MINQNTIFFSLQLLLCYDQIVEHELWSFKGDRIIYMKEELSRIMKSDGSGFSGTVANATMLFTIWSCLSDEFQDQKVAALLKSYHEKHAADGIVTPELLKSVLAYLQLVPGSKRHIVFDIALNAAKCDRGLNSNNHHLLCESRPSFN